MKPEIMRKSLENILNDDSGQRVLQPYEFRCSESWYCLRSIWLYKNFPESVIETDIVGKNKYMVGKALHKWVQTCFKIEGYETFSEWEINREFAYPESPNLCIYISGHADIVYSPKDGDGLEGLIELKSVNKWALQKIIEEDRPYKHHVYQANWMAWLLNLEEFYIVYVHKDADTKTPESFRFFYHKTDSIMAKNTLERLFHVAKCLDIKDPIYLGMALPHTKFSWECGYCAMREKCKELGLRPSKSKSVKI